MSNHLINRASITQRLVFQGSSFQSFHSRNPYKRGREKTFVRHAEFKGCVTTAFQEKTVKFLGSRPLSEHAPPYSLSIDSSVHYLLHFHNIILSFLLVCIFIMYLRREKTLRRHGIKERVSFTDVFPGKNRK